MNHSPFHLFQNDTTLKTYVLVIVKLLLLLLRTIDVPAPLHGQPIPPTTPWAGYHISLPANMRDKVLALKEALEDEQDFDQLGLKIISLLVDLWTSTWLPTAQDQITDPTLKMVMFTQLRADGSFRKPHEVTGQFARISFMMVSLPSLYLLDNYLSDHVFTEANFLEACPLPG